MSAGLHPADSLNHLNRDSGIPLDSIGSDTALARLWLPLRKPEDVKPFLADPDQYRDRRSAKLIAETLSAANKLPKAVKRVLD
jgi:hypothetical protein